MTNHDLQGINQSLRRLLTRCEEVLTRESVEGVKHYLDHDEYEMALEGLLIDLVAGNRFPAGVDWKEVVEIGRKLGLDREATFDPHVWGRFLTAQSAAVDGSE